MGNIAEFYRNIGASQAAPIVGAVSGFMDQRERMRQAEEATAKLQVLQQQHEMEKAANQQKMAAQSLALQQGDMRAKLLSGDIAGAAAGVPGLNKPRAELGLSPVEAPANLIDTKPDLSAVGPFDPTMGHARPRVATGYNAGALASLRGMAGMTPEYAVTPEGVMWDKTSGAMVRQLPIPKTATTLDARRQIADAANDLRFMSLEQQLAIANARMGLQRDLASNAESGRMQRFFEGQEAVTGVFQGQGPDGKPMWWGRTKNGDVVPLKAPGGGQLQAPEKGKGGGSLDTLMQEAMRRRMNKPAEAPSAPWYAPFVPWSTETPGAAPPGGVPVARPSAAPSVGPALVGPKRSAAMEQWRPMVRNAAKLHRVPEDLIMRIMQQESGGNAKAASPAGAIGLMQLMPDTARELGVNPYDPRANIEGGAKYLRKMLDQFGGDEEKARAAYNAGPGAVQKYGGVPPYPETKGYVKATAPPPAQRTGAPVRQAPRSSLKGQQQMGRDVANDVLSEFGF